MPRVAVGASVDEVRRFVAVHPLAPTQQIRSDVLARIELASYHIVQVRGRERPHRHAAHDITVHVLTGQGTLHVDGATLALRAGDVAVVPRDTPHWFENAGRETSVALVVFTPPLDAPDVVPIVVDGGEAGR
ncbi:MAG: cupin domain-containing protein [Candidatus Binatia bacterium]